MRQAGLATVLHKHRSIRLSYQECSSNTFDHILGGQEPAHNLAPPQSLRMFSELVEMSNGHPRAKQCSCLTCCLSPLASDSSYLSVFAFELDPGFGYNPLHGRVVVSNLNTKRISHCLNVRNRLVICALPMVRHGTDSFPASRSSQQLLV